MENRLGPHLRPYMAVLAGSVCATDPQKDRTSLLDVQDYTRGLFQALCDSSPSSGYTVSLSEQTSVEEQPSALSRVYMCAVNIGNMVAFRPTYEQRKIQNKPWTVTHFKLEARDERGESRYLAVDFSDVGSIEVSCGDLVGNEIVSDTGSHTVQLYPLYAVDVTANALLGTIQNTKDIDGKDAMYPFSKIFKDIRLAASADLVKAEEQKPAAAKPAGVRPMAPA